MLHTRVYSIYRDCYLRCYTPVHMRTSEHKYSYVNNLRCCSTLETLHLAVLLRCIVYSIQCNACVVRTPSKLHTTRNLPMHKTDVTVYNRYMPL
jgi:hypothetical protein